MRNKAGFLLTARRFPGRHARTHARTHRAAQLSASRTARLVCALDGGQGVWAAATSMGPVRDVSTRCAQRLSATPEYSAVDVVFGGACLGVHVPPKMPCAGREPRPRVESQPPGLPSAAGTKLSPRPAFAPHKTSEVPCRRELRAHSSPRRLRLRETAGRARFRAEAEGL